MEGALTTPFSWSFLLPMILLVGRPCLCLPVFGVRQRCLYVFDFEHIILSGSGFPGVAMSPTCWRFLMFSHTLGGAL